MKKYIRRLKLIVSGALAVIIFKLLYRKGFDPKDTIVICGSMRSGSTWLAELLCTLDGHIQLFEPLHTDYVRDAKKIITERIMYVPTSKEWVEGNVFFKKLLSGKLVNAWILSQVPLMKIFSAKTLVVKFVRANLLLPWLSRRYNIRTPVLVIRHPCSIITSQFKKGWPLGGVGMLKHKYFEQYPEIIEKCKHLNKPEEIAALGWCLRYHGILNSPSPQKFVLVSYEALVRNGVDELKRIYDTWNMPLSSDIVDALTLPSDTSTDTSFIVLGKDPLAGWQHYLSDEQVDNILHVIRIFNLDFYSKALEPDYKRLSVYGHKT